MLCSPHNADRRRDVRRKSQLRDDLTSLSGPARIDGRMFCASSPPCSQSFSTLLSIFWERYLASLKGSCDGSDLSCVFNHLIVTGKNTISFKDGTKSIADTPRRSLDQRSSQCWAMFSLTMLDCFPWQWRTMYSLIMLDCFPWQWRTMFSLTMKDYVFPDNAGLFSLTMWTVFPDNERLFSLTTWQCWTMLSLTMLDYVFRTMLDYVFRTMLDYVFPDNLTMLDYVFPDNLTMLDYVFPDNAGLYFPWQCWTMFSGQCWTVFPENLTMMDYGFPGNAEYVFRTTK